MTIEMTTIERPTSRYHEYMYQTGWESYHRNARLYWSTPG